MFKENYNDQFIIWLNHIRYASDFVLQNVMRFVTVGYIFIFFQIDFENAKKALCENAFLRESVQCKQATGN